MIYYMDNSMNIAEIEADVSRYCFLIVINIFP